MGISKKIFRVFFPGVVLSSCLAAPIQIQSVVNSASFQPGLGEPGSLATIFVKGLTGIQGVLPAKTALPLPSQLVGVIVTVNLGVAPILAVSDLGNGAQQINIQVPPERVEQQRASVRVMQSGSSGTLDGVDFPPVGGLFTDGEGNAVAVHVDDNSQVTSQNPAVAGESIAVYGTALGSTYPPKPVGYPTPAQFEFQGMMNFLDQGAVPNIDQSARELLLNGEAVHVTFLGLVPGLAGVDRLTFQVPSDQHGADLALAVASGVVACPPPPFANGCSFQIQARSNDARIAVR